MILDYMQLGLNFLSDHMPTISAISPVTMAGAGIVALSALLYLFTRVPEYLLVLLTAMLYAAAPLLH